MMVHDFEEGRILGELQDLQDEIEAVDNAIYHYEYILVEYVLVNAKHIGSLKRLLDKLKREKERQQMRLRAHRQKVKDSGIKY